MLNQFSFTDAYDCDKLRILQQMNDQIEVMAVKLDQIVSHVEEVHFKLPPRNFSQVPNSTMSYNNSTKLNNQENRPNFSNTNHQLVTINNDQLSVSYKAEKTTSTSTGTNNKKSKAFSNGNKLSTVDTARPKPPDTTAKRNKQQRQFNTFVRDSINQLLGSDFMRTHDVQDIDSQVMEMIRKEAVENYLPDNIRPRRAWHLAKASLRTLKRTLNNRKA